LLFVETFREAQDQFGWIVDGQRQGIDGDGNNPTLTSSNVVEMASTKALLQKREGAKRAENSRPRCEIAKWPAHFAAQAGDEILGHLRSALKLTNGSLAILAIACGEGGSRSAGDAKGGGAGNSPGSGGTHETASGGTAGGVTKAAAAGSPNSTGNAGAAGAPDSTAGGGSQSSTGEGGAATDAGSSVVAPHTCGVSSRLVLSDVPQHPQVDRPGAQGGTVLSNDLIRREYGGFAVGPWFEPPQQESFRATWLRVDPRDNTQKKYSADFSPLLAQVIELLPMGAPDRVAVIGSAFSQPSYATALLVAGGDPLLPQIAALFAGDYGTGRFVGTGEGVSLDGQRALFAAYDFTKRPPQLALVAADGSRVGNVLEIANQGECYTVLPTEHALAFALMEGADLHLIELSATGDVALDVRVPLRRARLLDRMLCPMLALTDGGIAVFSYEEPNATGDGGSESAWNLHRIGRDGSMTSEPWYEVSRSVDAFAVRGDSAFVLVDGPTAIVRRTRSGSQFFPLTLSSTGAFVPFRPIRSEAGSLFLDLSYTSGARELVELRCAD
jgi:hypothetical protein